MLKIDDKFTTLAKAVQVTEDNAREIHLNAKDTRDTVQNGARIITRLMGMFDEDCGQPTSEFLSEAAFWASELLEMHEALQLLVERASEMDHGERKTALSDDQLRAAAGRAARAALDGWIAENHA